MPSFARKPVSVRMQASRIATASQITMSQMCFASSSFGACSAREYTGSSRLRRYIMNAESPAVPSSSRNATPEEVPAKSPENRTRYCQMQASPAGTTESPRITSFLKYRARYFMKSASSITASIGINAKAKFGLKSVAIRKLSAAPSHGRKSILPCRLSQQSKKHRKTSGINVRLKSTVMLW